MPVFAWAGAAVAGWFFAAGTAAFIATSWLVATGAAYVTSRILNGNPNKGGNSAQENQGGRVQVPPATNNKIPVIYGNSYVNGIISDARLITTDQKINDTMFYCIVLSETCNDPAAVYDIENIFWNDLRLTTVNSTTSAHKIKDGRKTVDGPGEDFIDTNFIVDNKPLVQMRVYAGGSAAANQIFPLPSTGNTQNAYDFWADNDNSWTTAHTMKGLVYAIVRVTFNGEKGFTSLPNLTFQMNNSISNPADVWYDYMTSQRYGAGIDPVYIDTTAQTAWANFCDEDLVYTDVDGVTNQYTTRYSINGPVDTSRPVKENIDVIMQNAGAWLSYNVSTGLWSPIIKKAVTAGEVGLPATFFTAARTGTTLTVTNFPAGRIEAGQLLYNSAGTLIGTIVSQTAPTLGETAGQVGRYTTSTSGGISSTTFYTLPASMLSFTDSNIISGINISSTRLDDLYNSYEIEFYDKHNKDQKAYARDAIASGERNPNEPDNQLRMSLDLTNNSMQASLLGKLELAQTRDDLVVEFTTNHYGIQAQAGDVISITSELYDWNPKYFRVMRVKEQETEDGGLIASIQALEYNPDVYTIEPLTEFSTSANIGIGVYGASPNLPAPPVVLITTLDTAVAIPNFEMQIQIPTSGGPFDEIELYITEGWDPINVTATIVPGTGSNGAPVGKGLMTVTAADYGIINTGDYFLTGPVTVESQITNTPASKTFASGGAVATNTVTLNNTTGLLIGNNLVGTGLPVTGAHVLSIAGSQVTISEYFTAQAAGTYTVSGGLGTYIVDTSTTSSGTSLLYDLPIDSDYKYLRKVTPEGNNATFTNGETISTTITEVPANSQTYRRWFIKARVGIKKLFGKFSSPTITDRNGNFRYTPSPVGGGSLDDLSDVTITSASKGQLLTYDLDTAKWINSYEVKADTIPQTIKFTKNAPTADDAFESEVNLIVEKRITDAVSNATDDGGPSIQFARSFGVEGGVTRFGQVAFDYYGTTLKHRFVVRYSTDEFAEVGGLYPGTHELITSTPDYTDVNQGTLYVDAVTKRIGVNTTSPNYELHVANSLGDGETQFGLTNNERTFLITNNAADDKLTMQYNGVNRLQFDLTNQYFPTGSMGINNSTPAYTLDVTGDARLTSNLTVQGSSNLGNAGDDTTTVIGDFKVTNTSVNNLFVDHLTGYVGVNNLTPDKHLHVVGGFIAETSVSSDRALLQYNNAGAGPNSAVFLRKNYGASTFTTGDGVGIGYGLTSNTQGVKSYGTTNFEYSATDPQYSINSSTNNFSTSTNLSILNSGGLTLHGQSITLNKDQTGTPGTDASIIANRGDSLDAYVTWAEATDTWRISNNANVELDLNVDNKLTVHNDITQVTATNDRNIVTTAFDFSYSNSTELPGVFRNIDSWDKTLYRSAKYIISIENQVEITRMQCVEIMVVFNPNDGLAYMNTYSDIAPNGNTTMFEVAIDGANVKLRAYPLFPVGFSGGTTRFVAQRVLLPICS